MIDHIPTPQQTAAIREQYGDRVLYDRALMEEALFTLAPGLWPYLILDFVEGQWPLAITRAAENSETVEQAIERMDAVMGLNEEMSCTLLQFMFDLMGPPCDNGELRALAQRVEQEERKGAYRPISYPLEQQIRHQLADNGHSPLLEDWLDELSQSADALSALNFEYVDWDPTCRLLLYLLRNGHQPEFQAIMTRLPARVLLQKPSLLEDDVLSAAIEHLTGEDYLLTLIGRLYIEGQETELDERYTEIPLQVAYETKKYRVVEELYTIGVINDLLADEPLLFAVEQNNVDYARSYIQAMKRRGELDFSIREGCLLEQAVQQDRVELTQLFIDQGANPHVYTPQGKSLLEVAVSPQMRQLLEQLGVPGPDPRVGLLMAARTEEEIDRVLAMDPPLPDLEIRYNKNTPEGCHRYNLLYTIAKGGTPAQMSRAYPLLDQSRAPLNLDRLMTLAAYNKDSVEMIQVLAQQGLRSRTQAITVAQLGYQFRHFELLDLFRTPMSERMSADRRVKLYDGLTTICGVEADREKQAALVQKALQTRDRSLVQYCLKRGWDFSLLDTDTSIAVWLLFAGADQQAPAKEDRQEWFQLVLNNGADPNHADSLGNTALHYAAMFPEMIDEKTLLLYVQAGLSARVRNREGKLPTDLLKSRTTPREDPPEKRRPKLKRNAIQCNRCGDVIESRFTHDFVTCRCGACSVDGGLSYQRILCKDQKDVTLLTEYWEDEDQ